MRMSAIIGSSSLTKSSMSRTDAIPKEEEEEALSRPRLFVHLDELWHYRYSINYSAPALLWFMMEKDVNKDLNTFF